MAIEWAGWGPQLLLELDRTSATPLRSQVERHLRAAIRAGRLAAGERLPSSRALASNLGLSRGVIQECYAQLQAEGYLTAHTGSATRVAHTTVAKSPQSSGKQPRAAAPLVADFRSGVPDLRLVPRQDWSWAIGQVCRTAPNAAFDYGPPNGDPRLREVLAAYLRRVRAADAYANQVLICTGVAQGLGLVLRVLADRCHTRVAFEDPGAVRTARDAASSAGIDAVPVPVDEHGIDVAALARSGARVVVVTPAHQWPTGVVMAPERRLELLAWAREHDGVVVEDDYDAEFRYDREPVGALQGLAPDRVVSLGTVSKSLAPALRLGWAVLPPSLVDDVTVAKSVADRGTSGIDQLALATLIESGRYDRQLRRMRAVYARRRAILSAHVPHVTGLAAGFHAVAHLPAGASEQEVVAAARARGVGIYGMSDYRADGCAEPPCLVLGFGNTSEQAIETGLRAIADLLA
ncbi:PLP-dependent aminotransferase family protein [Actinoplanes subtropicus]|uniref:MocR-like pyridoxine biosynthesis transcription factor PdxR n=1 Tax=Actinoplanes subtropicus TaxID=543632 RepID=UPI0004C45F96|nr:PLP-dependent aminotransferase family protein [Actinoplanes subtropicus]